MVARLWPPLMPLTWGSLHIAEAAVAPGAWFQLAQVQVFHQKLARHDLRWPVMVVA